MAAAEEGAEDGVGGEGGVVELPLEGFVVGPGAGEWGFEEVGGGGGGGVEGEGGAGGAEGSEGGGGEEAEGFHGGLLGDGWSCGAWVSGR